MNPLVRIALAVAGMPDATVAEVEKSLPGFTRVVAEFKAMGPDIVAATPHIDALMPIFSRMWPTIKMMYTDINANIQTVEDLATFVEGKTNP